MLIVTIFGHEIDESRRYISERLASSGHDVFRVSNLQVELDEIPPDADAILIDFDADASEALNLTNVIKTDNRFGWTLFVGVTNTDNETLAGLAEEGVVDGMLIATPSQRLVATQLAFLQKRISENQHRREMLEEVSRHERRVEAILETSPDAIVTCVEDGTITEANRAATEMFGFSADQLSGLTIEDLMPSRYRERHVSHRKGFFHNPISRRLGTGLELFGQRQNSQEFPIDLALGWHDYNGQRFGTAALRDMTEQRELEYTLRRSKEHLQQAYARLESDLQSASMLQQSLLPTNTPEVGGVRFAWAYEACAHLAGDAIDIFPLDDDHLGFYLLDVCGHGTKAALLSVALSNLLSPSLAASTILRIPRNDLQGFRIVRPADVVGELNVEFMNRPIASDFFTMFYGVLDTRNNLLRFVSAGHPAFLLHKKGMKPKVQSHSGLPISVKSDAEWEEHTLSLEPNTRLYFMSDGALEAANADNELFGIDGVSSLLSDAWNDDLESEVRRIRQHAVQRNPRGLQDDVSMIAIEISSP